MVPIVRTEEIVAMVLVASFANVRIIILYSMIHRRHCADCELSSSSTNIIGSY